MPEEITNQKVMEAVTSLRELVGNESGEAKEQSEKINTFLDKQEVINQKNLTDLKSAENKAIEAEERVKSLELEMGRKVDETKENYQDTAEYKALKSMVCLGDNMDTEYKATLRTDIDTQGGYTVMGEMDNMITKKITEISGLRSVSRVRTISSKSLAMPIRTGILTANYEGEGEIGDESNSTYGSESLTPFRLSVTVPITHDLLMDSSFNMESEIFGDAGEAFAQKEGNKFILGTDVKQPEGILVNSVVVAAARTSGSSGTITADDMILLTGDLKTGYNPVYTLNRGTLAFLRTLKSSDGVFLWQPGMNGPVANTMNGFGYVLSQDMPAIAALSLSVAFGDFQRGYSIIDRTGVSIIRDDVTRKKAAIVEFTIHRWNYGKVVLPEAIKLLKTAA